MARIMIVDDDHVIRGLLREILEAEDHTVEEAADGQTALRHFAGRPTDLVISDVIMPEMDGIEFARRVKEAFPEAKIIGLSGAGSGVDGSVLDAMKDAGAISVLAKPFTVEQVVELVEEALASGPDD